MGGVVVQTLTQQQRAAVVVSVDTIVNAPAKSTTNAKSRIKAFTFRKAVIEYHLLSLTECQVALKWLQYSPFVPLAKNRARPRESLLPVK